MAVSGGVFSVLPTPFTPSGDVDSDSLKRVVDLFIADGVNGFTALGVTSEIARLTDRERDAVLDTILAHVNGRVPVVAGTTAEGLRTCIEYTRRAKAAGAAAVMISPPRMGKINSDAVARHFAEVAAAVGLPIIVQDYPPISGYAMEASLLARIAREVPAARTIKLEDPPTPFKTARILEQATGVDVARRKQYLYHERWRAHRDRLKFDTMVEFGRSLPRLRSSAARDLGSARGVAPVASGQPSPA